MMDYRELAKAAVQAKKMSYSPLSNFEVGAAVLTKSGKIYTGCNIESASYSPTICAERTAIFKAVSEGEREFAAIAVSGSKKDETPGYCYPCGVCRQVISEFGSEDMEVILAVTADDYKKTTVAELLPNSFGMKDVLGDKS